MKKLLLMVLGVLLAASVSYAGNVDTFGIGSRATALGGAYSATADDPFAAYYNPAGLSQIKTTTVSGGLELVELKLKVRDFHVENAEDPNLKDRSYITDNITLLFVPHLGVAMPIGNNIGIGLAVYAPWGMTIEWESDPIKNPIAYNAYKVSLVREAMNPTVSYDMGKVSFGMGVSLGTSKIIQERKIYISRNLSEYSMVGNTAKTVVDKLFAGASKIWATSKKDALNWEDDQYKVTDTRQAALLYNTAYALSKNQEYAVYGKMFSDISAKGIYTVDQVGNYYQTRYGDRTAVDQGQNLEIDIQDDFNYAINVGIMYNPNDRVTLGLTYRSLTDTTYEGDAKQDGKKVSDAELKYDHPNQVQGGIRYQANNDFSMEFDMVWTNWSINRTQVLNLKTPIYIRIFDPDDPAAPMFNKPVFEAVNERDWSDTMQIRFGAEYQLNKMIVLRGSYFYDPSPIPDDTLDFSWPDGDKKIYALGAGFNFGKITIDTVLQYAAAEQPRVIGGESPNLNHSYDITELYDRAVFVKARGHIWGLGMTFSYAF